MATFYTDTIKSSVISLTGNQYAQLFTNGRYTSIYPMKSRKEAGDKLHAFIEDVGVPETLVADMAAEQEGPNTEFRDLVRRHHIKMKWTERGRPNQNARAEREIGIIRQRWQEKMTSLAIPRRLWDYGITYESEVLSRVSRGNGERPGLEQLTGETIDISEWLDFSFYDLIWYHDSPKPGNDVGSRRLGRWLGVAHRVGSALCYWVLTESGKVIARTTVQHVTNAELREPTFNKQVQEFDNRVSTRLNSDGHVDLTSSDPSIRNLDVDDDWSDKNGFHMPTGNMPTDKDYGDMSLLQDIPEQDDIEEVDDHVGARVQIKRAGEEVHGTVTKRARGNNGEPVGKAHKNPIFDSREYTIEFDDGTVDVYTSNAIIENMYGRMDDEGKVHSLFQDIVGHRKNANALEKQDGFCTSWNGNKTPKQTTKGWEIAVEWATGDISWIPLRIIKQSHPVELAEYAVAQKIDQEPAFNWWVRNVLQKRNRVIAKIKKKYWRTTHKFGIRLPKTVAEALAIDRETGTTFWRDAIEKELKKVKVAWERRDDLTVGEVRSGKALRGYKEITVHMVFDVKMDFTRKARLVADGNLTDAPTSITYSSVVTRDSVRIALMFAMLNGLKVLAADVGNAYLNAPCLEKIWFRGGEEVGAEDRGAVCVLVRALYGLKSSGASWHATLAQLLRDMGFEDTKADPDVWRRSATKENGDKYYELVLIYVDDILAISENPKPILTEISNSFPIKEESIGPPDTYLGAQIYTHRLPDGQQAWGMTSEKYVKNAISTVEGLLQEDGDNMHFKSTARTPVPTNYRPELDATPELQGDMISRFRQLIGILRWAVELGRLDIYLEVALLSQYLAAPRQGHLEAAYHVFAFLKRRPVVKMVFDPTDVNLDESVFHNINREDWYEFYGNVQEELPHRMPEPRGKAVQITCFVDSDHAGNVVTRRSHTGILIFVQNAPILWYSKKQNTVESSSFGSEFVAMRVARDMIVALRYKLRMFGIPISGPANLLCDNAGVVKNTSIPESTLSKRHNAINYHVIRESAAAEILRVGKEDGLSNLADPFTKILPVKRREDLFSCILYAKFLGNEKPSDADTQDTTQGPSRS